MSIPSTVIEFLSAHEVEYRVLAHRPTATGLESAHAARVPADAVAKGVVLEDGERFLLAVIPATRRLDALALEDLLAREIHLVAERDFSVLFRDCRPGAVPACGRAYGVATVVDVALAACPDVYIEAGDHEHLIRVNHDNFERLMAGAERGHISHSV